MIFYVDDCEQKIGYSFKNKNLLRQCFTHASYSHEHKNEPSNERLEFFGDAILEYCISEYLYEKYPDCDEGKLTELRQDLVSGKPLAEAIKKCGLDTQQEAVRQQQPRQRRRCFFREKMFR